ncbi:MAG: DNA integrity scanning protein DisA nucleotide-binding domain protein, partial [Thermaerobacterales bacterium]
VNLFIPNTPLHDGAVIVRGDRVLSAGCFLPLTDQEQAVIIGSRHRAALGISEHSDAVAVVVSEETGNVSLAHSGKLIQKLELGTFQEILETLLSPPQDQNGGVHIPFWQRSVQQGQR